MKQKIINKPIKIKDIKDLLNAQSKTIFSTIDKKFQERDEKLDDKFEKIGKGFKKIDQRFEKIEKHIDNQTQVILSAVDERIRKSEERVNAKIEKLINTLDGFLKKTTDLEDEFEMMKLDLNRVKEVIRTKLGIKLD